MKELRANEFYSLIYNGEEVRNVKVDDVIDLEKLWTARRKFCETASGISYDLTIYESKITHIKCTGNISGKVTFEKCIGIEAIRVTALQSGEVLFYQCECQELKVSGTIDKFEFNGSCSSVEIKNLQKAHKPSYFTLNGKFHKIDIYSITYSGTIRINLEEHLGNQNNLVLVNDSQIGHLILQSKISRCTFQLISSKIDTLEIEDGKYGLLDFKAITIEDLFSLQGRIDRINITSLRAVNPIQSDLKQTKIKAGSRHSFRFLKNEALRQNDQVSALAYHVKEMYALMTNAWKDGNVIQIIQQLLNMVSNNFGSNWFVGLVFTISVSLTFFIAFLMSVDSLCCESIDFWVGFTRFFNPAHNVNNILGECFKITSLAATWDTAGRILTLYGGYQTAQAFRSLGKR